MPDFRKIFNSIVQNTVGAKIAQAPAPQPSPMVGPRKPLPNMQNSDTNEIQLNRSAEDKKQAQKYINNSQPLRVEHTQDEMRSMVNGKQFKASATPQNAVRTDQIPQKKIKTKPLPYQYDDIPKVIPRKA